MPIMAHEAMQCLAKLNTVTETSMILLLKLNTH